MFESGSGSRSDAFHSSDWEQGRVTNNTQSAFGNAHGRGFRREAEIAAVATRNHAAHQQRDRAISSFSNAMGPIGLVACLGAIGWLIFTSL